MKLMKILSKMARATSSVLKGLFISLLEKIMMEKMFPRRPKIPIPS
jgi:hypothetical protein